jgi:hypothetical protein
MKKPSYKRYERGGLVEFLVENHKRFTRGKAGRPGTTQAYGLYVFRSPGDGWCHSAYFGPRQDYDLCRDLLFSERHSSKKVKALAKKAVMRRVQDALNTNQKAFFYRLADSVKAVQEAPFDPVGVALGLAYKEYERIHGPDIKPLPVQLVEKAWDFFDLKDKKERDYDSLRVSLTTKATRLLGNKPKKGTKTGRTTKWIGQVR